jgi:hypothetical protein
MTTNTSHEALATAARQESERLAAERTDTLFGRVYMVSTCGIKLWGEDARGEWFSFPEPAAERIPVSVSVGEWVKVTIFVESKTILRLEPHNPPIRRPSEAGLFLSGAYADSLFWR